MGDLEVPETGVVEGCLVQRHRAARAVMAARDAWAGAPSHVKVMASAYVGPVILALLEIDEEMRRVSAVVFKSKG